VERYLTEINKNENINISYTSQILFLVLFIYSNIVYGRYLSNFTKKKNPANISEGNTKEEKHLANISKIILLLFLLKV